MRIDICPKLNYERLNEVIETGFDIRQDNYLIMSTDTFVSFQEELNESKNSNFEIETYRGCKILIDNALEYGIVDFR